MEKKLLNLAEVEQLTGITFKTIKKRLQASGVHPEKKRGSSTLYDAHKLFPALFAPKDFDAEQLSVERARLAKAQAEKVRIETDRLKGKLVDRDEWCDDWSAMLVDFKNKLLSLPLRIAPVVSGKNADDVYMILSEQIKGVLDELTEESQEKSADIELDLSND